MQKFKSFIYNATIILPVVSKIIGFIKLLYALQASNSEVIEAKQEILESIKMLNRYFAEAKRQNDEFKETM